MRLLLLFLMLYFSGFNEQKPVHILFVGNSLTYTNNLPKLVELESRKHGLKVKTKMLAFPNYALQDHWEDGELQKYIQTGKFDYVIVQQGPSSQREGKEMLLESGRLIKRLCAQSGSELVYLMVWPSRSYYHTFDGVIANHRTAAESNQAMLIPVGEVWKDHFESTGDYSYYSSDGFHPSLRGSQVAAQLISAQLFNSKATD